MDSFDIMFKKTMLEEYLGEKMVEEIFGYKDLISLNDLLSTIDEQKRDIERLEEEITDLKFQEIED